MLTDSPSARLRDHCPSAFDAATRQRATHHLHILRDIAPASVSVGDGRDGCGAASHGRSD